MPNCSFQGARTACINHGTVNELYIQSMELSNTLLSRHDEIQSQGRSNLRSFNSDSYSRVNIKGVSTRNYKANHKGEIKFGKCSSCGKFHPRNSCAFRNAECFKCGKIEYIQSAYKTAFHFASSNTFVIIYQNIENEEVLCQCNSLKVESASEKPHKLNFFEVLLNRKDGSVSKRVHENVHQGVNTHICLGSYPLIIIIIIVVLGFSQVKLKRYTQMALQAKN
ncbi:unnamed protein product [Schistosoma margrebowiei]|uniref:Uncharacterized protein n=1 Tax=Schistosoma margrebowiei TaxID=48269 RepID=A0A183LSC1_9TREM|nr:unnamed protein product [Schistosoma margrebowiei]